MKNYAVEFYMDGYNCSQCILKAAEIKYNLKIDKQSFKMCLGINRGFGIGCICSAAIAGIMIFGILFDKDTVKSCRIELLNYIQEKYGTVYCEKLRKICNTENNCLTLISDIANYIDTIIIFELEKLKKS